MLELWGMQSTPPLPSLPGPLWRGVVAPDKGPIYGSNRTKLWNRTVLALKCVLMLNWIVWNKTVFTFNSVHCPIGSNCWIHRLRLCRGKTTRLNECLGYDIEQSEGVGPVMLELFTHSLLSLTGPLWHRVVAPDRVLSMGQIELNCVWMLNWIAWNRTVLTLTVCKQKLCFLLEI